MVIAKLGGTAIKLSRLDKRAWDALYFGIRKDIKYGIRTGFGLGGVIGSFIDDGSTPFDDQYGSIPFKSSKKTYQFNKKYRRFGKSRGSRRYNNKRRPCGCC